MKKMMIMVMFLAGALSATIAWAADPVHYLEWDATNRVLFDAVCTDYTVVTESTEEFERNKWYVVNSTVHRQGQIFANDGSRLILCDGAKLTVDKGLVCDSDPVTIYGQKDGTGILEATGQETRAGIGPRGGSVYYCNLKLVINGGIIKAKGGPARSYTTTSMGEWDRAGAGIGSGSYGQSVSITINGGTVFAIGGDDPKWDYPGSGLGAGGYGYISSGQLTMNGGTFTALGGMGCNGKRAVAFNELDYTDWDALRSGRLILAGETATTATITTDWSWLNKPYVRVIPTPAPVDYRNWDSANQRFVDARNLTCTVVTKNTTTFEDGGWYVVEDDVTCGSITVEGAAHLILKDGKTLTVYGTSGKSGIYIGAGCSLTTYGQSANTGALSVGGGFNGYGIEGAGQFVINGGKIVASGSGRIAIDTDCAISVDPYKNKAVRLNSLSESTVPMSEFLTNSFYRTTSFVMMPYEAYYVTYDGNGAVGMTQTSSFQPGELVSLNRAIFEAIGYIFEGWTTNGTDVVYADMATGKDFAKAGETLALIAKWKPDPEPVKFSDAASLFSALRTAAYQGANLPATITFDSKVTVPSNWAIPTLPSTASVDVVYEDNGTKMWFENGVLYASPRNSQVSIHTLAIMVAVNDGKAPSAFKIREEIDGKTVENDVAFLYGYNKTFHNTIADALSADPRPWTVTLKDSPPYYVAYDGNGAAGAMSTSTFSPDELVSLSPVGFSAVGYLFEGWTINGKDVVYADEATGTNLVKGGETLKLIAKWKLDDKGVKISDYASLKKAFETVAQQGANFPVKIVFDSGVTIPPGDTMPTLTSAAKVDVVYEDNGTKLWLEKGVLYASPLNGTVPTAALEIMKAANGWQVPSAFKIRSKVNGQTVESNVMFLYGSDNATYDTIADVLSAYPRPAKVTLRDSLNVPEDYGLKEELTSQTRPGTPLENNTIYTVKGHVLISAKSHPGLSALKVPVGKQAIIEIPAGCSLTVIGGDAEEQIGAGAGIEVPIGAKLVICGEGKLTAIGGNAANGEKGHKGLAGEATPLIDLKTFPMEKIESGEIGIGDLIDAAYGTGVIADMIDSILFVGKGGTGGAGGNGGGGAAAGIGGKGGRGGSGGPETVGKRVVPSEKWAHRPGVYEEWFGVLGWEEPYLYAYANGFDNLGKNRNRLLDGATGSKGEPGANGMASGEIIIADTVRVSAFPGNAAVGGASGRCGKAYSTVDLDHDNTTFGSYMFSWFETGVNLAVMVSTGGAAGGDDGKGEDDKKKDDEDDDDDDDEDEEEDSTDPAQKLWFYGGGGGAGGAGGAAAIQGIGPGGAGGGGGGSGGSGLFIVGSNLADEANEDLGLEANGHGGLGGEAYIPAGANAEEIRAKCFGQDASALNGGESSGQEPQKSTNPEEECFNLYTNAAAKAFWEKAGLPERKRLGCWTTNIKYDKFLISGDLLPDCFAYAGLPGLGGKAGSVMTDYYVYVTSQAKVVTGLDEKKVKRYDGKVFCKLHLVIGDGQADSEDYYVCGTAVAPCVIPAGTSGKVFAGFFTKQDGKGVQYFDKFGNPSGFPFITNDTTLYAHWVDKDIDLGVRNCIYHEGGSFTNQCVTFQTGYVHYFKDDAEYGNEELSISGARISGNVGETAIFYIPEGVEVEFVGGNGKGVEPGYPGIEVPEGVTLVVTGGGRLIATGGDAGQAGNGANGDNGYYTGKRKDSNPYDNVLGGAGGAGGNGAGGAAPAIGGRGGRGGAGGAKTPGNYRYCSASADPEKSAYHGGNDGQPGAAGSSGTTCGKVCIVGTLSVVLNGGDEADGGYAGAMGTYMNDEGSGNTNDYSGTGGGGGGGGAGAPAALTIGGGIGGGGGGAGGGSGSTLVVKTPDTAFGSDGAKGRSADGLHDGEEGNIDRPGYWVDIVNGWWVTGGKSYYGGAAGANGGNGTYSRGLNLNVTKPLYAQSERVADDIVFGHPTLQRTITFTHHGQKIGRVLAMMGEPLPTLIVDQLEEIYGFEFAGAYLVDEKGEPILDALGFEDWWYDDFGYGEKTYDVPGDVTLEVHLEPKADKMADWPETIDFVYDGKAHRVLEKIDPDDGFTVVGGTLVATNAGIYSVELKMKDGLEVWSDAYVNADWAVTNQVRTWHWSIRPAEVNATFENQKYDWNATNNTFGVTGKVPAGMTVDYRVTDLYASGVFEVKADIKPVTALDGTKQWKNYLPKTLSAVCTVPHAINVKEVHTFCETCAAFDFTLADASVESILANYTNITVCAAIETDGRIDLENAESVKVCATIPTSEARLGYGTAFADFKVAFPNYRGQLWTWLAIDGVPASELSAVTIDSTGVSPDGAKFVRNFRYDVFGYQTNLVFTIEQPAGTRYCIEYKAADADDWDKSQISSVGMPSTIIFWVPYLGENALYRLREVKSEK